MPRPFLHASVMRANVTVQVLEDDFFLSALKEEFVENARLFIFETYCRIHQCINLQMLAGKLNMDVEVRRHAKNVYLRKALLSGTTVCFNYHGCVILTLEQHTPVGDVAVSIL